MKSNKRECGDCTFCCKILPIDAVASPPNIMCSHCTIQNKCTIYENRPQACKDFSCEWLTDSSVPLEIRPDLSGVMFETITPGIQLAMLDIENLSAWTNIKVQRYIEILNNKGVSVIVSSFSNSQKVFIPAEGRTKDEIFKEAMDEYNKEFKK